ncbi:MAG: DUF2119 family protein [Methanobacteriaceae archaeon]
MTYLKYILKCENALNSSNNVPTKLFFGGIHGNESKYIKIPIKTLPIENYFGENLIYIFDESEYISTLKKDFWKSENGKKIISFVKKYNPDFYIELHSYNIKNYEKLVNPNRRNSQGVPPLIELEDRVLISSVSPLIRTKYFSSDTVCITLELPVCEDENGNDFINPEALDTYSKIIKLIAISKNREDLEKRIIELYPIQRQIASKYAEEVFKFKKPF